nr:hypothetical protein [uncultured Cohaesibacter sp.]
MATEFSIKRIDDKSLIRIFEKAQSAGQKALDETQAENRTVSVTGREISLQFSSNLPWQIDTKEILKSKTIQYAINTATLRLSLRLKVQNNQQEQNEYVAFQLRRGDSGPLVDTFQISNSTHNTGIRGKQEVAAQKAMHSVLSKLLQPVSPEDGGLVPTLSNLAEGFNTTYQRITFELSDAIKAVNSERAKQLSDFQEEGKRLREEAASERDKLLKEAHQKTQRDRDEIESIRSQLAEEWTKLEISSHKDSRRKQFQKLQDDLQSTLSEPVADKGLRNTRWAVFWALCTAGIAAGFFAYLTISSQPDLKTDTASLLFPAIRSIILTFASIGSFLGAAAWLRYFYVRDLQAQEELRRFRNDMARASWVMDAALEIRKEHNEEIPPQWIAGVTEGLFAAKGKETLEEGAQALAALMGLSASASFGSSGATFELNKKGGKKIAAAGKQLE